MYRKHGIELPVMDENRADLRRWIISATIVIALHGGLVMALVHWHKAIPTEPFVMDLAPWSGASGPELGAFQPEGIARSSASEQAESTSQPAGEKAAAQGGAASAPSEAPQARTASGGGALQAQPGNGRGGGTATGPAPNGSVANNPLANNHPANIPLPNISVPNIPVPNSAGPNNPVAGSPPAINPLNNTPIDTSITVQPPLHGRNGLTGFGAGEEKGRQLGIGQKGQIIFRPSRRPGELDHPRHFTLPGATAPGIAGTRIPGAHVQDRARAAMARQINAIGNAATAIGGRGGPHAGHNVATNAIGIAGPGVGGKGGGDNGAGNVTINAIGLAVQVPRGAAAAKGIDGHGANSPSVPAMNFAQRGANSGALGGPALSGGTALDGRTMIRRGAASGVIGGPAGRASGVLSGTDFHPRIP